MGPRSSPVRVLTVDDQPRFLSLARQVVRATPGFEPVAEAAAATDGIALAARLRPDIVLMGVRMPGLSGFEAARRILTARTARMVVLLSPDFIAVPADLACRRGVTAIRKEQLGPAMLRRLWAVAQSANDFVAGLDDHRAGDAVLQAAAAVVEEDHEEPREQRDGGERQPDEAQQRAARQQAPSV